jgi:hypothetical protein
MEKHELSKIDFEMIDDAFRVFRRMEWRTICYGAWPGSLALYRVELAWSRQDYYHQLRLRLRLLHSSTLNPGSPKYDPGGSGSISGGSGNGCGGSDGNSTDFNRWRAFAWAADRIVAFRNCSVRILA